MVRHVAVWVVLSMVSILLIVGVGACNVSDETAPDEPECVEDEECPDGVCEGNECIECRESSDCTGDQQCEAEQCVSGCEGFDCGEGGSCVEDDQEQISCECDGDSVLIGGVCEPCDCEVANGEGECSADGDCLIAACDEGYFTEDDDAETGCECAPTDHPDPQGFEDQNCDGLDGDFDRAIFVSTFGDDENDGIRTRPVETITRAIELASEDEEKDHVYIAEVVYEERVELSEPISLFGGYFDGGNGDWERGEDYATVISGVGVDDGHRPVVIEGVEESVELQRLRVEADEIQGPSIWPFGLSESAALDRSSVAISAQEVEELILSHVEVVAGDGRVGGSGGLGVVGIDGSDGEQGQESTADDNEGHGGEQNCDGADVGGGDGGLAGDNDGPSEDGGTGRGETPGEGGEGGELGGDSNCSGDGTSGEGGHGEAGADGEEGADGEAVEGEPMIEVGDGIYYSGMGGQSGEDGEPGSGGGGGGGGGGYDWEFCFNGCNCGVMPGGGGGGGGSGGCGGSGGGGGGWGGASVAVMAYESQLVFEAADVITADGGEGGPGGAGSQGGDGGEGGEGVENELGAFETAYGGDGGDGGTGGTGGGGSGGMGGASVGIMSRGGDISIDELTTFDLGEAGKGGAGGGEDNDGPQGVRANHFEIED